MATARRSKIVTFKRKDQRPERNKDKVEILRSALTQGTDPHFFNAMTLPMGSTLPMAAEAHLVGYDVNQYEVPIVTAHLTSAETDANMDKLTDQEKREVSARKRFLAQWEAASLKSADQLPDLQGAELTLAWDWLENEQKHCTVIRHGHTEVWHELACYEGYERFQEILKILKAKYGSRLVDVVPTDASTLYLHGVSMSAIGIVQNIRKSLKR